VPKLFSTFLRLLLIGGLIYATLGIGFYAGWKIEATACREARLAQGEWVEPEVFSPAISLAFTMVYWPVYLIANLYHFGTPFSTPCSHAP